MRRIAQYLIAASLLSAASLGTAGCADNDSMLFVRQVVAVEAPECEAKPDPSGLFRTRGVLDVAFALRYDAVLLVGNQLERRGSREQVRTETSRVTIRGSEIRLLDTSEALIEEFTVPGSGFVDPSSGESPGFGLVGTTLIPQSVAQQFDDLFVNTGQAQATVIANVKVFGETLGGEDVESSELTYPITVCRGCTVTFPPEADDPIFPGFQCTLGSSTGTGGAVDSVESSQCLTGQDDVLDCRLCCANFGGVAAYDAICRCT